MLRFDSGPILSVRARRDAAIDAPVLPTQRVAAKNPTERRKTDGWWDVEEELLVVERSANGQKTVVFLEGVEVALEGDDMVANEGGWNLKKK